MWCEWFNWGRLAKDGHSHNARYCLNSAKNRIPISASNFNKNLLKFLKMLVWRDSNLRG